MCCTHIHQKRQMTPLQHCLKETPFSQERKDRVLYSKKIQAMMLPIFLCGLGKMFYPLKMQLKKNVQRRIFHCIRMIAEHIFCQVLFQVFAKQKKYGDILMKYWFILYLWVFVWNETERAFILMKLGKFFQPPKDRYACSPSFGLRRKRDLGPAYVHKSL